MIKTKSNKFNKLIVILRAIDIHIMMTTIVVEEGDHIRTIQLLLAQTRIIGVMTNIKESLQDMIITTVIEIMMKDVDIDIDLPDQ